MSTNFEQYKRRHNMPAEPKMQVFTGMKDVRMAVQTDKPAPGQHPSASPAVGYADIEEE